jgi:hypothetical protein
MRRSSQIWIPHAEVNDVLTPMPRLHLHAIDNAEDIRRQPLYALEFHPRVPKPFLKTGITPIYKASWSLAQLNRWSVSGTVCVPFRIVLGKFLAAFLAKGTG